MYRTGFFRIWRVALVAGVLCYPGALSVVDAQTIELGMYLRFTNRYDDQSGGSFSLGARASGGGGIAELVTRIEGIDFDTPTTPVLESPETLGWLDPVPSSGGPVPPLVDRGGGVTEFWFVQDLDLPISSLVYEIGHGAGTPGSDPNMGFPGPDSALLATGTFPPGSPPHFSEQSVFGSEGQVFDAVGSDTTVPAAVTVSVRDNSWAKLAGDYNDSGRVGQGDLDLVLLNWGQDAPPIPEGWINDQPDDGRIDGNDLDTVLLNWGNQIGTTAVVPEPESSHLLAVVFLFLFLGCSSRPESSASWAGSRVVCRQV